MWGFTMIMTSQPILAQEPVPSDNDFLVFVTSHPTNREIANRITNILAQSFEKAERIDKRQELIHGSIGSLQSKHEQLCTELYFFQKQMELLQWQHRTAGNSSVCKDVAQIIIIYIYSKHIKSAKEMAWRAAELRRIERLTTNDHIDAEIMLDRTVLEWQNFLVANRTEEGRSDHIFQLLKGNVEKAESIIKELFHKITLGGRPPAQPVEVLQPQSWIGNQDNLRPPAQSVEVSHPVTLATSFARLYAEFYLQQKQIELLRWQYESTEEENARTEAMKNLVAANEKQLVTVQKLVDMSKEMFQQLTMTITTYLHCETLLDNTALELLRLTNHENDQTFNQLEKNVKKAEKLLKEFEEQQEPANLESLDWEWWKRLCLRHVEFYLHQKQIELLRWQYEKAERDEVRQLTANDLVAVYIKQVVTAKKIAQTNAELFECTRCTMKDYLDSETKLDQTKLDLLDFMLKIQTEHEELLK
jgi:hypothetical protein